MNVDETKEVSLHCTKWRSVVFAYLIIFNQPLKVCSCNFINILMTADARASRKRGDLIYFLSFYICTISGYVISSPQFSHYSCNICVDDVINTWRHIKMSRSSACVTLIWIKHLVSSLVRANASFEYFCKSSMYSCIIINQKLSSTVIKNEIRG